MTKRTLGAARRALALALLMVGSLWLCGCGTSIAGLCEDACDCENCDDDELEECIEEGEEYEAEVEEHGCGDAWDDYIDCLDDSFECEDGDAEFDDDCKDELRNCDF